MRVHTTRKQRRIINTEVRRVATMLWEEHMPVTSYSVYDLLDLPFEVTVNQVAKVLSAAFWAEKDGWVGGPSGEPIILWRIWA